jgi:hypothetical protein
VSCCSVWQQQQQHRQQQQAGCSLHSCELAEPRPELLQVLASGSSFLRVVVASCELQWLLACSTTEDALLHGLITAQAGLQRAAAV